MKWRGRGIPAKQTVDLITENVVIPPWQPQNGTTADMIATMFQQEMESLVEKIQTQPRVNMIPEGNIGHNQSDEPLHRCHSGSQCHPRTAWTEGASIVQSSGSAPTKQNHKGSTLSTGQTNRTTTTCPSCHRAHSDLSWREISACLRCGQMGHYKRHCPCNHRGPSQISTSMNGTPTNSAVRFDI
ncbi:hypothetical protein HAX54_013754 [Datura stramonium]|uniref:CCHC-type domain-containing protein n=1 Tax=Datura stramonium TaxID=4076 RepID=A0ABS8TND2_DATST|nr:hypothetical protein [Datura stramonium]